MDINTFFQSLKSQNVSLFTLIIIVIVALAAIFFLGALTFKFARKIRDLTKQRYGFGGKPIFSLFVVLTITIAIPLTLYASYRSVDVVKFARAEKDVVVEMQVVKKRENLYSVSFMAIPVIDNKVWADRSYTITWTIKGEIFFEKVEKERSNISPSYFVKELPSGTYEITVVVESEQFSVKKKEELVLE